MSNILREPATGPTLWQGDWFERDLGWIHELSNADISDLEDGLAMARRSGVEPIGFTRESFPLRAFGATIERILDEVQNGRGFAIFRGLPVERYERADLEMIYWAIGAYMGQVISQNGMGDLIAEVTDKGASYDNVVNDRGYMSKDKLNPHVDTSDMTALLCLRTSGNGGMSSLTSSAAVYNEILSCRPDLLEVYYRGFHHDLRGEGPTGSFDEVTQNRIPVFSYHEGLLSCCYNDKIMRSAHDKTGQPLTDLEMEAIDLLLEVAELPELRCDFELEVGDIQFINNYVLLHARSAFESDPDPAERRCLLRMWMNCRNPRPLATNFADRYNTGPRGGVFVRAA
jgi:alpha-ketoglutarate-dependent taurine dioxygenase